MSARIRLMKSSSIKSKNIKNFAKTAANFMKKRDKSLKLVKEFNITRTTGFSDNTLTRTIASSIRTISKFKTRKKERPLIINLENFHKDFILNKNKDNNILTNIYNQNAYNSIESIKHLSNKSKNLMKLKKKYGSPPFLSANIMKSRNLMMKKNKNLKNNENQTNSQFSSFLELFNNKDIINKNNNHTLYLKEISKISKKDKTTNSYTNNSDFLYNNFFFPFQFKDIEPIYKRKKTLKETKKNKILNKKSNNNVFHTINTVSNNTIRSNTNNNYNCGYNYNYNYNFDYNTNHKKKIGKNSDGEKETKLYLGHNTIRLNEQLAYPSFNSYLFSRANRYENIPQFMYKTRLMIFDKYIKNIYNNNYTKQLSINDNMIEKQNIKERSLVLLRNIFFSYNKTLDDYIKFLFKKYREMQEENEALKINIVKILTDIEKIKQKMIKGITQIREGYAVKFFLMCVKNHTLFLEKFEKEDIEEIEKDKVKLKEDYYFQKKVHRSTRQSVKLNNLQLKQIKMATSEKSIITRKEFASKDDNVRSMKTYRSYRSCICVSDKAKMKYNQTISVDDFFDHLNAVASKLNYLIKDYCDKCSNNIYIKIQFNNLIKNSAEQVKESIALDNKIKQYEQNLANLKNKNQKLLEQFNKHKDTEFKNDVKLTLVLKHINRLYKNIRNKFGVRKITKEDINSFGYQIYMKVIEDFFWTMMSKVNEDKIKYSGKFEELKIRMEKQKKKDAFITFQRLLAQKIEIKIDSVLKRASKVIYHKFRKTNDYREYYRNKHIIKKEDKEIDDIELFFEYIKDDH